MGDTHVTTFDGRIYMHTGKCQYVLAKSRGNTKFTVMVQYTACGEVRLNVCVCEPIHTWDFLYFNPPHLAIIMPHVLKAVLYNLDRESLWFKVLNEVRGDEKYLNMSIKKGCPAFVAAGFHSNEAEATPHSWWKPSTDKTD